MEVDIYNGIQQFNRRKLENDKPANEGKVKWNVLAS